MPDPERLRQVKDAAATHDPGLFVDEFLLGGDAFIFDWDPRKYADFRRKMAAMLMVAEGDVELIGSAKLGFSLNRDHLLRGFRRDSDLDLVVVASELFDSAVLELRARARELELAGEDERRRLRKSRESAFNGYLRPDQLPMSASLMTSWFPRLAGPFDAEPARSHPVKAWLFKSREHARLCYTEYQESILSNVQRLLHKEGRR